MPSWFDQLQHLASRLVSLDLSLPSASVFLVPSHNIMPYESVADTRSITDVATTALRGFPSSISSSGAYLPLNHRYRSPTTKALATRLLLDREILFDTLTQYSHQPFRSALHEANERIEKQHFVRLRSPDDYELTQFGLNRERLEGQKVMERVERGWGLHSDPHKRSFSPKGRARFSTWVRKLSST